MFLIAILDFNKILCHFINIIQIYYVAVMRLNKNISVKFLFPIVYRVVRFNLFVSQIQHGFSVFDCDKQNLIKIYSAKHILVAGLNDYCSITIYLITQWNANSFTTATCCYAIIMLFASNILIISSFVFAFPISFTAIITFP